MKKHIIIIIILFLCYNSYGHELNMAIFEITRGDSGYVLNINFDRRNLEKSLVTTYPELINAHHEVSWRIHIQEYLAANFQLIVNEQCTEIDIHAIDYEQDYIRITASLPLPEVQIQTINVFNTCLIDYNETHSNLIRTNVFGKARAFRLDKDRIEVVIK
ncbi:hypothetical protein FNH22_04580 [Fulvivirga sp. M361]|uniref:DUF6702 family protein n=1 Tax=Fulvivirga sp. M361 TaxID=2594266 RepID=UPI00117B8F01|nr:DUF6702 family protein [Fulvivirga sp. M361]TRX61336.1 hypothetical protein FNH22_04580 [Fulvivirga sp. M361]